jgi:hypothetical protein
MSEIIDTLKKKFGVGVKPIINPKPEGLPPIGAILMISDDLRFIVKHHLRRNRLIIQMLPVPKRR